MARHRLTTLFAPCDAESFLGALREGRAVYTPAAHAGWDASIEAQLDEEGASRSLELLAAQAHVALLRWALPVFSTTGPASGLGLPDGAHPGRVIEIFLGLLQQGRLSDVEAEAVAEWSQAIWARTIGLRFQAGVSTGTAALHMLSLALPPHWVYSGDVPLPDSTWSGSTWAARVVVVRNRLDEAMLLAAHLAHLGPDASDTGDLDTTPAVRLGAYQAVLAVFRQHGSPAPLPDISAGDRLMLATDDAPAVRALGVMLAAAPARSPGSRGGRSTGR